MKHRLTQHRNKNLLLAASLSALVVVAGCGSRSGSSGQATSPASAGSGRSAPSGTPITLAVVAELSGAQASIGQPWKDGVDAAVKEINADGGILGHPVKTFTADTQSDTAKSVAAIRFALDKKPYAVIGPVLSDSLVVDVKLTGPAKVPEFVGGIVDSVTQQGNKYVVRTNPSTSQESKVNAKFLADNIKAKKVAIVYRNDQRGQGAKAALSTALKGYNVDSATIAVSPDQTNYSGLPAKISDSGADAIYLSATDTQDAQIITALKGAGNKLPITGDTEALSSSVSQLTHNASDGVRGVVDYSPAAPGFKELASQYTKEHGSAPTAQFYKAYIGTWLIKYATENAGKVDATAMMDQIHGHTFCVSKYPHLLQSFYWAPNGDPDGAENVAEVVNGAQNTVDQTKPLDESKFSSC